MCGGISTSRLEREVMFSNRREDGGGELIRVTIGVEYTRAEDRASGCSEDLLAFHVLNEGSFISIHRQKFGGSAVHWESFLRGCA